MGSCLYRLFILFQLCSISQISPLQVLNILVVVNALIISNQLHCFCQFLAPFFSLLIHAILVNLDEELDVDGNENITQMGWLQW